MGKGWERRSGRCKGGKKLPLPLAEIVSDKILNALRVHALPVVPNDQPAPMSISLPRGGETDENANRPSNIRSVPERRLNRVVNKLTKRILYVAKMGTGRIGVWDQRLMNNSKSDEVLTFRP